MDSKFQNYRSRFVDCVIYGCKVIVTGATYNKAERKTKNMMKQAQKIYLQLIFFF